MPVEREWLKASLIACSLCICLAGQVRAGDSHSDLRFSIEVLSTPPYAQGDSWTLAFSVENLGPDPAIDNIAIRSGQMEHHLFDAGEASCPQGLSILPFGASYWWVLMPPLAPGESYTCINHLVVEPADPEPYQTTWFAAVDVGNGWVDPNFDNNLVTTSFDPFGTQQGAQAIPALSSKGRYLLIVLLIAIGLGCILLRSSRSH